MVAGVLASVGASLGGCSTWSRVPGEVRMAVSLAPGEWPRRDIDQARRACRETPEFIAPLSRDLTMRTPPGGRPAGAARGTVHVVYKEAIGQGLLRVFERTRGTQALRADGSPRHSGDQSTVIPAAMESRPVGDLMRFVSYSYETMRPVDERFEMLRRSTVPHVRASADTDSEPDSAVTPAMNILMEGVRMQVIDPEKEPSKGLIVYLQGLGSREYESPVVEELRRRGWTILSVTTPRVWWFKPIRFDVPNDGFLESTAARIAEVADDQLADPAYAIEAALDYLEVARPDLSARPTVMMGFSAGALFAPAAAARVHDRLSAVALIGGGANLLEISQTSDLTNGGIELHWATAPGAGERRRLFEAYLKASKLDPAKAVRAVADKPVLLVQAEFDTTVPARSGRLLAEQLPGADRLHYTLGHRLMFWALKGRASGIADWVERACERRQERLAVQDGAVEASHDTGL